MAISYVLKQPAYTRCIFTGVFGDLSNMHPVIKQLVENPTPELRDQVAIKPGYPQKVARSLVATQDVWRDCVVDLQAFDPSIPEDKISRMFHCKPPHVSYRPRVQAVTCRDYFLCPHDRYRKLIYLHSYLTPKLAEVDYIGMLVFQVRPKSGMLMREDVERLRDEIAKIYARRWNTWPYDAVLALPKLVVRKEGNYWVIAAAIIALTSDLKDFWSPLEKMGVRCKWEIHPATPGHLAALLTKFGHYPPQLLYDSSIRDMAYVRHACMTKNGPVFRSRLHGIEVDPKKNNAVFKLIDGGIEKVEFEEFRIHGRCAPETPDLAEPYWDPRRCIPSLTTDYRALLKAPA
jgi:hypothetical protein